MTQIAIIVPVYNEEKILYDNINRLYEFLHLNLHSNFEIIILDSYSKDRTAEIAKSLVINNSKIKYLNIESPGKGGKIKKFVRNSDYDYYAFIDADLPISLDCFLLLVNSIMDNSTDLAIASRYILGARSHRKISRKIASKVYNSLLNLLCDIPTHDAFAGAKAWNKKIKSEVWPKVNNLEWFFDTELIYYTAKYNYDIKEIPVIYNDFRSDSKVHLLRDSFRIGKALLGFLLTKQK